MTKHSVMTRISIGLLAASMAVVGAITLSLTTADPSQAQMSGAPKSRKDYYTNSLSAGQTLYKLGGLTSKNKCFNLVMQNDGNLVIYDNAAKAAQWNSGTAEQVNAYKVTFQRDGNFVMYTRDNEVIWKAENTDRKGGKFVIIQNDGNLVMYNNQRKPIWATNTSRNIPQNKVCRF